ncbi:glycogen synthase GlgA [Yoonia sp. SS1-5]|uniref:Glycogen synthase n=1 Tax=Yoonia rhodophyticola TaxID=3137370 RepID=A0AAN0NK64_9RHOB
MVRVLSVASECAPLIKTGGLADVVGALPAALAGLGATLRTMIPGYPQVAGQLNKPRTVAKIDNLFGGPARILSAEAAGLALLVVDAPHLFDREGGIYLDAAGHDWPDNPLRFAALSYAAAHVAVHGAGKWRPDVVHGHDWQAGLVLEYMHALGGDAKTPFIFTIHNVAFHGNAPGNMLEQLQLDPWRFNADHFEFWGQISALKAGLMGADKITTVSQTYAEELMTDTFGMGMEGVLRHRQADLTGIVNGIDTDVWNPATDPEIQSYKTPRGKAANKKKLQAAFGLEPAGGPLCVLISRLTSQKGIDLLIEALPALLDNDGQLALLGSGEPALEVALHKLAAAHPNVGVQIGYDEALSHRMMAGGDAILVPSRFEPCGLTQLYGLRYGTVPLVGLTGGLADTVINASPAALSSGAATGVQFFPVTAGALGNAFHRLSALYAAPKIWAQLQRNGMKQAVGWERSAVEYHALYAGLAASD